VSQARWSFFDADPAPFGVAIDYRALGLSRSGETILQRIIISPLSHLPLITLAPLIPFGYIVRSTGAKLPEAIVGAFLLILTTPICKAAEPLVGVASVIDGDTIVLHGERIRLNGIDPPESQQLCEDASGASYRCGRKAPLALADCIHQKSIRCEGDKRDRYGRLIATRYLGNAGLRAWDAMRLLPPQTLGLLDV
jgi:hypothetical protein